MSANRTQNCHVNRLRHRNRISDPRNHHRKFQQHLAVQAPRLNAIGGVSGVTGGEIEQAHRDSSRANQQVRARFVRGATTSAEVAALGIPIA